jgi:hypothetical protein
MLIQQIGVKKQRRRVETYSVCVRIPAANIESMLVWIDGVEIVVVSYQSIWMMVVALED